MTATVRIAIVAGEASGDILGASLMRAITARIPAAVFEGVGGPLMLAQGFNSHFAMDRLSVMGLVEPLKRLPELLSMRRALRAEFLANPPDLFLGIDSPDFNLDLELALRGQGLLTAHYVSPSVWAWRQGRVKKIAKAVDHMLTLFPFEEAFYSDHGVPVSFVGHPLADQFPVAADSIDRGKIDALQALGFTAQDTVVALLPGSRGGEVKRLAPSFIETARWCLQRQSGLKFIVPAANAQRYEQLQALLAAEELPITLLHGQSHLVMQAADAVLMASGTTTLEALLLRRPMVVAYKMSALSYAIISRMVKSPYISLPNLLAGEELVPEILQDQVRPDILGPLLLAQLQHSAERSALQQRFSQIHRSLRQNASERAADILLNMIEQRRLQVPVFE